MKYLFSKGELKRRMDYNHLWNNGELILDRPKTPVDDEPFVDIKIITLKAHLESLAVDKALEHGADLSDISEKVSTILINELNSAKEFIEVTPHYIRVGINCDMIDDKVIADVWELLSRQEDLSPGTKIELGQLVQVYENKVQHAERAC